MPELNFLTDLFEMIAALAALGVTAILYLETRRMRSEINGIEAELRSMLEEARKEQADRR